MGDLLGSVAALLSGLVIAFTGWTPIDPMLSLAIGALILFSSLSLLREALHGLMEGAPFDIAPEEVGRALAGVPGVASVHDLHIWQVKAGQPLLSALHRSDRAGSDQRRHLPPGRARADEEGRVGRLHLG